jgi:hypothetical protein
MSKKLEICIGKWGHELTMNEFTPQEYKKITDFALKNEISIEDVFLYHAGEVLGSGNDWYDFDNLGHYYGPSSPHCTIMVFNESRELLEECNIDEVDYKEVISKIEEDINNVLVTYVSSEKGNLKTFELELKDNEEFDIQNLKLEINVILTSTNVYEIVNEATYNGEPLYGDGGGTTGKGLNCDIKLPLTIIEEEKQLTVSALQDLKEKEKWLEGEGPQTD